MTQQLATPALSCYTMSWRRSVHARELRLEVRLHHRDHLLNCDAHPRIKHPLTGGILAPTVQSLESL